MECDYKTSSKILPANRRTNDHLDYLTCEFFEEHKKCYIDKPEKLQQIETDLPLLINGIPCFVECVINGFDVQQNLENLMKYSMANNFVFTHDILNFAFISALKNTIDSDNSCAKYIIIFLRNLWKNSSPENQILFKDDLILSFCRYLSFSLEIKLYAFDAIDILLRTVPEKLPIFIENGIIAAISESVNYFLINLGNINYHPMIYSLLLILTLVINNSLESIYFEPLYDICLGVISSNAHEFRNVVLMVTYHSIVKRNEINTFTSIQNSVQILIQSHLEIKKSFLFYIYKIDEVLWNCGFGNIIMNETRFLNILISTLTNNEYIDYLEPIYYFMINVMPNIWPYLFNKIEGLSVIEVILEHLLSSTANIRLLAGICISLYIIHGGIQEEKINISLNGGFNAICELILSSSDRFLLEMLRAIHILLNLDYRFIKEAKSNDLYLSITNLDNIYLKEQETHDLIESIIRLLDEKTEDIND